MATPIPNGNGVIFPSSVRYDKFPLLYSSLKVLPLSSAGGGLLSLPFNNSSDLNDAAARGVEVTTAPATGINLSGMSVADLVRAFLFANRGSDIGIALPAANGPRLAIKLTGNLASGVANSVDAAVTVGSTTTLGVSPFRVIAIDLNSYNLTTPAANISLFFIS